MSLGYLMELIAALAVGLMMARSWLGTAHGGYGPLQFPLLAYSFLAGVILVGSAGLWVERARGRGPRPWGIGRVLWSLLGVACVFGWAWDVAWDSIRQLDPLASVTRLPDLIRYHSAQAHKLAWLPLALLITSGLAGRPRGPRADAREWAGRVLGLLITVVYIENEIRILGLKVWWRH